MAADHTLLFTDIVDSTAVNSRLGDAAMAALWDAHDRQSRDLLRRWNGREVDRSDGFLMLFDRCADAVAFSVAYHRMLATLPVPLAARAGIHVGPLTLRETPADEVAVGAKPVEVVGIAKAIGARVMTLAQAGQTLLSAAAHAALAAEGGLAGWQCVSHGHWRLKGLEPLEVFEVGEAGAPFIAPEDSDKGQRVALVDGQWVSAHDVPHNLPAEREPIVGRQDELRTLDQEFRAGTRLLTITGAGGMGKTRLALRFAWAWLGEHPGGVWFCDLSTASDIDGLLFAVGQGLEVPPGKDGTVQLGRAIAGRGRCLVVLDNFEQVRRHARDTLGRWLDAAPRARFVVTSREVLGLPGEHTLALAPLSLDAGARLFHQRALAAHAGHDPTAHAEETRQLISLLDGMPLAIELAAPRVRVMSPPVLLARMGDRFRLLATTDGRPDRQATLRATLAWSWDMLTPAECSMLAQLSVFEGGFSWTAAQQVVALDGIDDAPWLVDVLQSLVEKSLVTRLAHGRFGLLRSVQDFASEQLQRDDCFPGSGTALAAACRRRHHRFHAQLDEAAATADGCAELDNLVGACRQAVRDGDADDAVACLRLAWAALRYTGPFQVSATLAEQVRQMPGLASTQAAEAERMLAITLRNLGANAAARAAAERGLAASREGDAPSVRAGLNCLLAEVAMASGDFDTSSQLLQTALVLAEGGDAGIQCSVLNVCGVQQQFRGHLPEARTHYLRGLEVARAAGLRRWQGGFLNNLAGLDYSSGLLDEARSMYEQALQVSEEVGNKQWLGDAHCNLGLLHLEQGRPDDAERHLQAALSHAQSLGYARLTSTVNCNLGLLAQHRGDLALAVQRIQMAVDGAVAAGDTLFAATYMSHLAPAQALSGDIAAARATLDAAAVLLPEGSDPQTLGLLACSRCDLEVRVGDIVAAQAALQAASEHLTASGAGLGSELGRRIAQTAAALVAEGMAVAITPC
jgi:predicted ATPase/class 3 adenylate cyclase